MTKKPTEAVPAMTTDEKLDQILKELRAMREILEGLMQPLVVVKPTEDDLPDDSPRTSAPSPPPAYRRTK